MYLFLINSDNMIIEVLLLALLIRELLSIYYLFVTNQTQLWGGNPHWMNGRKKY